jgi:hypothetical protein
MMAKGKLDKLITQLMILDVLIGLTAYLLQPINTRLTGVFIISLVLFFWLLAARFFSFLDSLAH